MSAMLEPVSPVRADGGVELPPLTPWPARVFRHPRLMHYNRLIALVFAGNLTALGYLLAEGPVSARAMSNAALTDFALAVLVRQQYVINALFWMATRAPTHWPLRIRWTLGKVYHFGGLHVGGAMTGTLWFLAMVADTVWTGTSTAELVVAVLLAVLLAAIVGTALPPFRARFHDHFERIHRFGGWAALALLWVQTVLVAHSDGRPLRSTPAVWVLASITFSVALPWLRLRRVPVTLERPSSHVVLAHFDHG
ncbi:MAG: hypothetical protein HOV83_25875, partial [Catenulispora sp.]|nr:hypothetical protein [Catenulispora sp.]